MNRMLYETASALRQQPVLPGAVPATWRSLLSLKVVLPLAIAATLAACGGGGGGSSGGRRVLSDHGSGDATADHAATNRWRWRWRWRWRRRRCWRCHGRLVHCLRALAGRHGTGDDRAGERLAVRPTADVRHDGAECRLQRLNSAQQDAIWAPCPGARSWTRLNRC